jgi:mannose-6-phosphate isomerase
MPSLYPFRFQPIFRRYLWGGRRLGSVLGKAIGEENCAESWEVVDHGEDQSIVTDGPLAGTTLGQLVRDHGAELFGRDDPQPSFPLLWKFLDAAKMLSLQVHPNDEQAARLIPPDLGKTEAWVVLAAEPGSLIYAGLKRGFDRAALEREIHRGTCELCLHRFEPRVGDCVFIPAGTVHAIGAGLLVAEIQQASDTTYRLFDWNRVCPDGKPRELHVEQGLDAIDFGRGPVSPQQPMATDNPKSSRLVECDKFFLDRWQLDEPCYLGGDDRFHIIACLEGSAVVHRDPRGAALTKGETILLPAAAGAVEVQPLAPTVMLDAFLP